MKAVTHHLGFKGEDNGVPLPTTAALLGLGLLALGRRRYKRRHVTNPH